MTSTADPTAIADVRRSLVALELATLRCRAAMQQRLNLADDELSVLLHLALHGGIAQRRVAAITTLSRSGAGAMLQRLEQDGYVERETRADDRRLRYVELTATGRARIEAAERELATAIDGVLAQRSAAELGAVEGVLDEIAVAALLTLGEDPSEGREDPADPIWRRWS